jgi:protein-serine/threonine kinase
MDSALSPEPGPSRAYAQSRAASIAVQPHSAASSPAAAAHQRQHRASHQVAPSANGTGGSPEANGNGDGSPTTRDVYAHPAAVAYAQQHPRRAIPKFGPYLLLQTLGEGEFGKVKLGLHSQWGEEVAVKLIRRNNIDSSQRMTKVEREIEVLRVRSISFFWNAEEGVSAKPCSRISNIPTSSGCMT